MKIDLKRRRSVDSFGLGVSWVSMFTTLDVGPFSINWVHGRAWETNKTVQLGLLLRGSFKVKHKQPLAKGMVAARALPRLVAPPRQAATSGASAHSSRDATKGRVLIVDDDMILRSSLRRLLASRGYSVQCVQHGLEAIPLIEAEDFDVVISDIAMPQLDGLQMLRRLKDADLDIPVVLITGEPAVATAVKALEYGAFHYMSKPFEPDAVEEVIGRATRLKRMTMMRRKAAELVDGPLADEMLGIRFQRALESLWMAYQPIVCASTGRLYGYEALLRSEEESLPHPGAVLDAAERLDQLDALGQTIRARAAQPVAEAAGDFALFVNLHTTDLLDERLYDPDVPLSKIASRVVLEVTERSSLEKVQDLGRRVARLREMGFRIAVDDLGAGYAGLTSFALLEPEVVKLDMSLVRDVHASQTRQKLIRSMTAVCKDMGMLVVGEGVESRQEHEALVELGCDLLQGYAFARPGKPFPSVSWSGR